MVALHTEKKEGVPRGVAEPVTTLRQFFNAGILLGDHATGSQAWSESYDGVSCPP